MMEEVMAVVDHYHLPFDYVLDMRSDVFAMHVAWITLKIKRQKRG